MVRRYWVDGLAELKVRNGKSPAQAAKALVNEYRTDT